MESQNNHDAKYAEAQKKVKEMKGFYIHLFVYIIVNLFIISRNFQQGDNLADIDNYWTAILWGIGVLVHAIGVFVPNFILGKDWEDRKIRELMDKYK